MKPLKPKRGGFLRTVSLGLFIHDYLAGRAPFEAPRINPDVGSYQANIFFEYKMAVIRTTALDRATKTEEIQARKDQRLIDPDRIEELTATLTERIPYKANGCRYHSFVVYFSNLIRLHWVEPTGQEETSYFQEHYTAGQPRKYYRLTDAGKEASEAAWRNPRLTLYGLRQSQ